MYQIKDIMSKLKRNGISSILDYVAEGGTCRVCMHARVCARVCVYMCVCVYVRAYVFVRVFDAVCRFGYRNAAGEGAS